jgi:hypothetical protein
VALKESYTFKRGEPTRASVSGTINLVYGLAHFVGPNEVEIEGAPRWSPAGPEI